jgi:GNAT superfamily N-acetyltransferase
MTTDDIPLGMKLKARAGWNQLEDDWKMILENGSCGCFVARYRDEDVGTITALDYGSRFRWIGMLLVFPDFRRMGIGRSLLGAALANTPAGLPVRLDATPEGHFLYKKMGFADEYVVFRLIRKAGSLAVNPPTVCKHLTAVTLPRVVQYDRSVFGADRASILTNLFRRKCEYARYVVKGSRIRGFCLGRTGSHMEHIGPIVAEDDDTAESLIVGVLERACHRDVLIDVPEGFDRWDGFLSDLGFRRQRPFFRMHRGDMRFTGRRESYYAVAGPEIG